MILALSLNLKPLPRQWTSVSPPWVNGVSSLKKNVRKIPQSLTNHAWATAHPWTLKTIATCWNEKWYSKNGYRVLYVRLPEQFSLVEKPKTRFSVASVCNVFGIHRSSYRYWFNRPRLPDAQRVTFLGLIREVHHASKLMKELNIVSCLQPEHRYKKATKERVDIPNHLDWQFAVTEPNQVWCGDITYISGRANAGLICRWCQG